MLNPRQLAVQIFTSGVTTAVAVQVQSVFFTQHKLVVRGGALAESQVTDNGLGKCYLLLQHGDIWISD